MKIITFAFKSTTIDMKDMTFTEAKNAFDAEYGSVSVFTCFLSVHQTFNSKTSFRKKDIAEVWDKQLKAYLKESEDTSSFTLDDFIEKDNDYNSKVGIYELDKTAKYLKEKLNKAIDDVVNDKKVMMEFS